MFLDKLQSGVLGFETERGVLFVQPSGFQKVHLLWTFRNFPRLSIKLLNAKQTRLVEDLYRTSTVTLPAVPDFEFVIGMVEGANFPAPLEANPGAEFRKEVVATVPPHQEKEKESYTSEKVEASQRDGQALRPILWPKVRWTLAAGFLCIMVAVFTLHRTQAPTRILPVAGTRKVEIPSASWEFRPASAILRSENPPSAGIQSAIEREVVILKQPGPAPVERTSSGGARASKVMDIPRTDSDNQRGPEDRSPPSLSESRIQESQTLEEGARVQFSRPPRWVVYPEYPATHANGEVALKAVLTPEGAVREAKVLCGDKLLADAALRAVRQWRYAPYYKDGQSVETETNISISFISADAISISFPAVEPIH